MNSLKGIENGRAQFAYECALEGKKLGKDYKQYVKKIPMMIKTNGLGNTFAFMLSKNGKSEGKVYMEIGKHIFQWFEKDEKSFLTLKNDNEANFKKPTNFEEFILYIVGRDSQKYRMITMEVLSFISWLKRFADGLITGEE